MTLIDGDRIITALLYDDEHEEFIEQKMSIIDNLNTYTNEGVTTADDVLEKIRAEIEKVFCMSVVTNELRTPMEVKTEILQIIDKYKAESEEEMTGNEMALMANITVEMQEDRLNEVLDKIRDEIKEKIEQEEFARSVFRHEEKDTIKAEQCTGSIMAYNNAIKLLDKYKAESEVSK